VNFTKGNNMKKNQTKLPRISADKIATNLRKSYPVNPYEKRDKAYDIASHLAKTLTQMDVTAVNREIFPIEETKKNARIWTQVMNILEKK
jgi:hypothetical protein